MIGLVGAGFAGFERREGGGFVVEIWDYIEEAEHLENHFYVADGLKKFEGASAISHGDEGADDGADTGAVNLSGASEIEEDFGFAAVD